MQNNVVSWAMSLTIAMMMTCSGGGETPSDESAGRISGQTESICEMTEVPENPVQATTADAAVQFML